MSVSVTAAVLRELHRIHKQLADLNGRIEQGPRVTRAAQAVVVRTENDLQKAKDELTRVRMASDEKQLQLKEREGRIESLGSKLNTAASNREYQALKEQIAADEQANSVLSDEIFESLEKIDELEANEADLKSKLDSAQEELAKTTAKVEKELAGLEQERERVRSELAEAESVLPGDFLTDYRRIAAARGEDALAQVDGSSCGACFTNLTPNSLAELTMEKPVFCKSCGALLYLPENDTVGGSG